MEEFKLFNDISEDIKNIRYEVFCVEQKIDEKDEWDGLDKGMFHFCLYLDGILIAYCRCYLTDTNAHIGRVVVKKEYRKAGNGRKIIEYAEKHLFKYRKEIVLGSQLSAKGFYSAIGYKEYGDIFLDAGIEHIMMKKAI